jgi:hypothetical protein
VDCFEDEQAGRWGNGQKRESEQDPSWVEAPSVDEVVSAAYSWKKSLPRPSVRSVGAGDGIRIGRGSQEDVIRQWIVVSGWWREPHISQDRGKCGPLVDRGIVEFDHFAST